MMKCAQSLGAKVNTRREKFNRIKRNSSKEALQKRKVVKLCNYRARLKAVDLPMYKLKFKIKTKLKRRKYNQEKTAIKG